jgi:hypothetical protein
MPAEQAAKAAKKPAASAAKPAKPAPKAAAKPAAKVAAKPAAKKPVAKKPAAPAAKAAAKPAIKAVPKAAPMPPKSDSGAKEKGKKPKLVRDSFTMPEAEYRVLGDLKKACLKAGFEVKKSELLRIGVAMMQKADVAQLKTTLAGLPPLKAGRPKKSK